jgi:hypothetical protein
MSGYKPTRWSNTWARTRQADAERQATQQRGELAGEQATIEAQMTELHHRKSTLETEQTVIVELNNAWAQAWDVAAAINRKGFHFVMWTIFQKETQFFRRALVIFT